MSEGKIITTFSRDGHVHAVWRDENDRRVVRKVAPDHVSSFVLATPEVARLIPTLRNSKSLAGLEKRGLWYRIDWRFSPWDREKLKGLVKYFDQQVHTPIMEADVSSDLRWMIDAKVGIARPKRCFLDIETDSRVSFDDAPRRARILVVAIVDEVGGKREFVLQSDTDEAEKSMLLDMFEHLQTFDQVAAWNGERFDFPMLRARAKRYGIRFDFDAMLWVDHLVLFKRLNMQVAESGEEKQSFALDSVARSILGIGKLEGIHGSESWQHWEAGSEKRELLVEYCVRDTDLMRLIEDRTGYLDLMQTLAEVCGIRPDSNAMNPTRQIQGFVLRLGYERGEHFPTKIFDSENESSDAPFEGAFVLEPRVNGVMRDVHVADFSGMYPSIVRSWNMSVETCALPSADEDLGWDLHEGSLGAPITTSAMISVGCCRAPLTGVEFRNEPDGLIAYAMGELVRMRKHWNDLKASLTPGTPEWKDADRRSTAYKVAANAFYGVLGNRFSRFYRKEVAESVSTTGKWLLLKTIEASEALPWGFRVIYADTDSIFVTGVSSERFAEFVAWANAELYPRLLKEQGCSRNFIKLDYQESFSRIVFTSAKRYAACFSIYKGKPVEANSKLEIKGLEYKRGDSAKLARQLQSDIVDMIVRNGASDLEALEARVLAEKKRVLEGDLPLELVVSTKALSKGIDEYGAASLPHVRVAKILKDRGRQVMQGTKISYVVIDGKKSPMVVIPGEDYNGECDRVYLWEKLIYPPTQRFLEAAFPGGRWERFEKASNKNIAQCATKKELNDETKSAIDGESTRVATTRGRRRAAGNSTGAATAARAKRNKISR